MLYEIGNPIPLLTKLRVFENPLSYADDLAFGKWEPIARIFPLSEPLLEHQVTAAAFVASRPCCILADDMGLGKTRSAVAGTLVAGALPCLVICQAGLRLTWRKEILAIAPGRSVLVPDSEEELTSPADFTIIAFNHLKDWFHSLMGKPFASTILDEAHAFKNETKMSVRMAKVFRNSMAQGQKVFAHRTAIAFEICKSIPRVCCLTGTPLVNRPKELFNLLALTRHRLANDFISFSTRFCDGHEEARGWVANGASNLPELRKLLHNHMLRRTKSSVLALPRKTVRVTRLIPTADFTQKYNSAFSDYIKLLKETGRYKTNHKLATSRRLMQLNLLRQICSTAKVPHIVERIASAPCKTVVFASFKTTINLLKSALEEKGLTCVVYSGKQNDKAKFAAVEQFQTDPDTIVFLATIGTGKTGITLTKAIQTIFCDVSYSPADHMQGEDRNYRIGQTCEVLAEYFIFADTVEEWTLDMLATKKQAIAAFLADDEHNEPVDLRVNIRPDLEQAIMNAIAGAHSSDVTFAPATDPQLQLFGLPSF